MPQTPTVRSLGAIGAEIRELDLSHSLDSSQRRLVMDAYNEHAALLFRDQVLGPPDQIALTEMFGDVSPHPLPSHHGPAPYPELAVVEHRPGLRSRRNDIWHSDVSFTDPTPTATVLHAIEVPEGLGDTLFCNMVSAYRGLSDGLKAAIADLRCVHDAAAETEQVRKQESLEERPPAPSPVSHPLVRKHAESGEKSLYANPHYVTHIEGFTAPESAPLLSYLYNTALRPENIYRHRWRAGDVLMWDNSRAMHYAIRDYDDNTVRIMHRTMAVSIRSGDE